MASSGIAVLQLPRAPLSLFILGRKCKKMINEDDYFGKKLSFYVFMIFFYQNKKMPIRFS